MKLTQLIYASRATAYVNKNELQQITAEASANNRKRGVTGALMFCDGFFLQLLEGDEPVVLELFTKISDDPRHVDVLLLRRRAVTARVFSDWGMSCLHEDSTMPKDRRRLERLMGLINANAELGLLGTEATELIADLRRTIARQSNKAA